MKTLVTALVLVAVIGLAASLVGFGLKRYRAGSKGGHLMMVVGLTLMAWVLLFGIVHLRD